MYLKNRVEREKERERETDFHLLVPSPATTAMAEPGQSHKPRAPFGSPTWGAVGHVLGHSQLCWQGLRAEAQQWTCYGMPAQAVVLSGCGFNLAFLFLKAT